MKFWKYSGILYVVVTILFFIAGFFEEFFGYDGKGCPEGYCTFLFLMSYWIFGFPVLVVIIYLIKMLVKMIIPKFWKFIKNY